MASVSDLENTPLSGLKHIDALLDIGPDWNFVTTGGNTIYYTFSITSGNEVNPDTGVAVTGQDAFTLSQQAGARTAFNYLREVTGINFVETATGSSAQIHLANLNIQDPLTTGLCSWLAPYSYSGTTLINYKPDAYVYLDNAEWRDANFNLTPGSTGYQTLLHELGHALGLKHPFEDSVQLGADDDTSNTLMSYTDAGGPYSAFSPYDIAALNWLYGRDGLGGALGMNSTGRYITGTTRDDTLQGKGGNDVIDGGDGNDTALFSGVRSNYNIGATSNGDLTVSGGGSVVTLKSVEQLRFADMTVQRANVVDTTPPGTPVIVVQKNASTGYLSTGNTLVVNGQAEANSLLRVYSGNQLISETRIDNTGVFSIKAGVFADGTNYSVRATATDAAGNVSAFSAPISFNVDATPPVAPTGSMSFASPNQPVFEGKAEAGTLIQLVRVTDAVEIGRTVVKADGTWRVDSPALPNGVYKVLPSSVDIANNSRSGLAYLDFTIDSALNLTGDGLANRFSPGAGNNAIDGMGGIDTVAYAGTSSNFTIERGVYGVGVTDKSGALGTDNLVNVERIQFADGWKAIDIHGIGGQVYRLYEAVFGRPSDTTGMGYWINRMEKGTSLLQVSKEFITNQPEFDKLYGANPSDGEFLIKLYQNILDRAPDAAGYAYWVERIVDSSREQILMEFSEGFENQAQVIGTISGGIDYTPWTGA